MINKFKKSISVAVLLTSFASVYPFVFATDNKDKEALLGINDRVAVRKYLIEKTGIENSAITWDSINRKVLVYSKPLQIKELLLNDGASFAKVEDLDDSVKAAFEVISLNDISFGFKKTEDKEIKDIDSQGIVYKHIKTGATLVFVKNDDKEKSFGIGFKTIPSDNTGVNHIIEHSVLNGSEKFPVKNPFILMEKQSLKTFLNAMTFSEFTVYPVASKNEKDIFNLMSVYLDAVFKPSIYTNKNNFLQEGWRYEKDSKTDKLNINGTVFNEMKGYYSDPKTILTARTMETLFPDTDLRFESGGNPENIPELTYENYLKTHSKFYRASNSMMFLYGDLKVENFLKYINENYLSKMDDTIVKQKDQRQKAFEQRVWKVADYKSTSKDGSGKSYLELSYVVNDIENVDDGYALEILMNLFQMDASPIKRGLLESGLIENVDFSLNNYISQPVFSIYAENIEEKNIDKFEKIVKEKLEEIADKGFEQNDLDSVFNRFEMSSKMSKQGTTKGPSFNIEAQKGFLYAKDPLKFLSVDEYIQRNKSRFTKEFVKDLINKYFVKNNHSALVFLKPQAEIDDGLQKAIEKKVNDLDENGIKSVNEDIVSYQNWQNTKDTPENIAKVPVLSISDLDTSVENVPSEEKEVNGIKYYHYKLPTNGLSYITVDFDASGVKEEDLLYLSFLVDILGSVDTQKYSFAALDSEIGKTMGGVSFSLSPISKFKDSFNFEPKLSISFPCTTAKIEDSVALLREIISNSKFNDKAKIVELAKRVRSKCEESIKSSPGSLANYDVLNNMMPRGRFMSDISVRNYYKFLDSVVNNFSKDGDAFIAKLQDMNNKIFSRKNLMIGYSGDKNGFATFMKSFDKEFSSMNSDATREGLEKLYAEFKLQKKENIAYVMPYKTVDIYIGGNFVNEGYQYSGKFKVLEKILNTQYLWNEVRDKLGAYGAGSIFRNTGNCLLYASSAQDLKQTLGAFDGAVEFLHKFDVSKEEMDKYIIGTVGDLDMNLGLGSKGANELNKVITGQTNSDLEKEISEAMSTTPADIRAFGDMLDKVLKQKNFSAAGSIDVINANKELFDQIVDIF